jgi:hypothetical protein
MDIQGSALQLDVILAIRIDDLSLVKMTQDINYGKIATKLRDP